MSELVAHCLRFEVRVARPIDLDEPGSALRGALFHALRGRPQRPGFCLDPARSDCHDCPALAGCPVSFLLATVDENGRRGDDVPRPYTIEAPAIASAPVDARPLPVVGADVPVRPRDDPASCPPRPPGDGLRVGPGQSCSFGVTVFGRAVTLFPYLIVGVRRVEEEGIGRVDWATGRRGCFDVERILAENPLTGERQVVLQRGDELVAVPAVPVRHDQVLDRAHHLAEASPGALAVEFASTTRLVEAGRALRVPAFRPLVQRLIERLSSLWERYGGGTLPIDFPRLMALADQVRLASDETTWVERRGYSTRQRAPKHLHGFVGRARYEGPLAAFLPWLVWAELTHVGKDAVKGCGRLRLAPCERHA